MSDYIKNLSNTNPHNVFLDVEYFNTYFTDHDFTRIQNNLDPIHGLKITLKESNC